MPPPRSQSAYAAWLPVIDVPEPGQGYPCRGAFVVGTCQGPGEPHSCPYQSDVNDNGDPAHCTCCSECAAECAADI